MPKIFPDAPSSIIYPIVIFTLVLSILYIDSVMEITTNIAIFFLCSTVFPIFIISQISRIKGHRFDEFLGFKGDPIFILSMFFLAIGLIALVFFLIVKPLATTYIGQGQIYRSIIVMYMPLSTQQFWFVTVPVLYGVLFYFFISIGEEILKTGTFKMITNWIYDKFGGNKTIIIVVGFLLSLIGWIFCHAISWGFPIPLMGFIFGISYSIIFVVPYFLGEPILSSEKGIQISSFSIYAPISAHFGYDVLLFLMTEGYLTGITTMFGVIVSVGFMAVGGILLFYKYYQAGILFRKRSIGYGIG